MSSQQVLGWGFVAALSIIALVYWAGGGIQVKRLQRIAALPSLETIQLRYIHRVLRLCEGDIELAAKVLGIGRATIYRKLTHLVGIETKGQRVERERQERKAAIEAAWSSFTARAP